MKYNVTHRTEYVYGDSVPLCHNIVRLRPRDTDRQTCLAHHIRIEPEPAVRREREDFFGNSVTLFTLQEPHASLSVTAESEVDVRPATLPKDLTPPWEQISNALRRRTDAPSLDARQYLFESLHVRTSAAFADYARPSFTIGRPLLDAVEDLTIRIYREFKFVPGVTAVGTPIEDVLQARQGVCQDFAHLQIACLRSLGLAARYVSGYLLTQPPPGKPRLKGADASHAWVSVYFPGNGREGGWIDFDPTNGLLPGDQHITVAWARDYDDVAPVRGVLIGGHQHKLKVGVDVTPVS
ncbi:MAG TPA: transglutaminase family protein [Tepidisphaeraceae bacterium]|jgi:transglutaminase-like putative cysteine protease